MKLTQTPHDWVRLWWHSLHGQGAARKAGLVVLLAVLLILPPAPWAATAADGGTPLAALDGEVATAPVAIDGLVLFRVRGVSAYPADSRAATIQARIERVARDASLAPDQLQVHETEDSTDIRIKGQLIISIVDADAEREGVRRQELGWAFSERIREAITNYRLARRPEVLRKDGAYAFSATIGLALALLLVVRTARRLDVFIERRWRRRIQGLDIQSFEIVRAERLWSALRGALSTLRGLVMLAVVLAYLHFVLGLFPWTRELADRLLATVLGPLATIMRGIVADIPDLVFLTVLIIVVRYVLKLARFFFDGVARESVTIAGFQPQWAWPTFKIFRFAIIAFTLVVAYPYIPGSGSAAFKGVSLFLGVVFSLGSTSVIANTIAGYALIYRRAFQVGDRVKINDMIGDVVEIRLQVTHLCSLKNEEVIVPNSLILNSQVINYSSLARSKGLILHTIVGIGYEVPWRQVEILLLTAADRTPGLLKEPRPFILHKSLGDFAVNYELNVYCGDARAMMALYTELHRNILDQFNEYGVQIMTPAYVSDPEQPKVVPKAAWYPAPAQPEEH